jgi:hypothetical protein
MTPEELNRTISFIVESQARLSAHQELDREHRVEFEKWARNLLTQMAADRQKLDELIDIQSRRLDRSEARLERSEGRLERAEANIDDGQARLRRAEEADRAAQQRHEELLREMRASFDRVLDKLSEP